MTESTKRTQELASARTIEPTRDDDALAPGRTSRSGALVAPTAPIVSGLIMRKRDGNGVVEGAGSAIAAAASGSGASLPTGIMRKFEASLGADLSAVRVHTDDASAGAASAVGAKAYTVGNDIHFGAGYYDPSSTTGEHLLAHEVAHTVQQAGGVRYKLEVSAPGDAHEVEADLAADAMVAGGAFQVTAAPGAIARDPRPDNASYASGDPNKVGAKLDRSGLYTELDEQKKGTVGKLFGLGKKLFKLGSDIEARRKDAHFWQNEKKKSLAGLARDVNAVAGHVTGLATSVTSLANSSIADDLEKADKGFGNAGKVLSAIDSLGTIADQSSLDAFMADPSEDTAGAWADQIADAFDKASGAVDLMKDYPFIGQYFAGLMRAPKAYITAFKTMVKQRYAHIDEMTGVSTHGGSGFQNPDGKWAWQGTVEANAAYGKSDDNLRNWLAAHREIDGTKLEKLNAAGIKSVVTVALSSDDNLTSDQRRDYLAQVRNWP